MTADVLQAPIHWQVVDFISDLHLQAGEVATFDAWQRYMRHTQADAVFILGDLFEVWVGDDAATPGSFESHCAQIIASTAERAAVFFMHGNRDFLVGPNFISQCHATLLPDPTVLAFAGVRYVLSHGDAMCLDDTAYQQFRATVRSNEWQRDFLAKPLTTRQAIARGLRLQSEAQKKSGAVYADVDTAAALGSLHTAKARLLIHGHTHRPADHALPGGFRRVVLSDWDAGAQPPRAEILRLERDSNGQNAHMTRLQTTSLPD